MWKKMQLCLSHWSIEIALMDIHFEIQYLDYYSIFTNQTTLRCGLSSLVNWTNIIIEGRNCSNDDVDFVSKYI